MRKMLEGVMDAGKEPESDSCGAASSVQRHSILMVSDFFYPNVGGVEAHIYQLGLCLLRRGHKVVVLTHAYGKRCGVRFVTGGMKVYYVPRLPFLLQCTFPTFFGSFQLLRSILIRERITLVHAHQAFSTLGYEAMLHARTMGYRVVFTDHSLFGFADAGSIWINKVLKWVLADVHAVICVSHTSKENTVLRACLPPSRVSVVPNAVDTPKFAPQEALRPPDRVRVVVLSRLVYRKGVDLLKLVIPEVCARWSGDVEFVIGGDGSKRPELESMIAEHQLQRQVSMLGAVEHHRVREVLAGGHIFLNASLTEAFCMAIVEAASTGCLVVSTAVGGVPEVLPRDIVRLAEPEPAALLHAVNAAIQAMRQGERRDAWEQHRRVAQMYSWSKVTTRTERVYRRVQASTRDDSVLARLCRLVRVGAVAGPLACLFAVVDSLVWRVICLWAPEVDIDIAPDFDRRGFPSA